MGRKKIQITQIQDDRNRQVSTAEGVQRIREDTMCEYMLYQLYRSFTFKSI
jgi:hypothetical protein